MDPPGDATSDPALGPELYSAVCGARPSETTGQLPSYTGYDFAEWTPLEHWMGSYTATLGGQGAQPGAPAQHSTSQSSQASATEVRPPESGQGGDGASGSGGKGGMGGWFGRAKEKVKRWKNRTPVQQEANKAAQKRYRERKKGQVAELQAQADSLAAQARSLLRPLPVQALAVVKEENERLEATNSVLEQQLSSSSPNTSGDSKQMASSGRSEWQSFNDHFLRVVEDLGAFLRAKGVRPSAADEGTLPEVVTEINERLMAAMHNCMQALNLGGLKLQSLIDAVNTRRALGTHSGHEGQTGCSQAPAKLNLTPEQIKRGLQYRAHVLSAMEKIYAERVALNQRVAGMLRAAEAAGPDLAPLLADLKANLAAEMRAASEQHFLLLRMLLSPTQGAWLLVESFPMHCDCLAFFNGLHAAYGDASVETIA